MEHGDQIMERPLIFPRFRGQSSKVKKHATKVQKHAIGEFHDEEKTKSI